MKTHHPQDPNAGERQSDYSDASSDISSATQDMRMMQTRLADLLDQVSVASVPAPVATSEETNQGTDGGSVEPDNAEIGGKQSDFASPSLDTLPSDSTFFSSPFSDPMPTPPPFSSLPDRVDDSYPTIEPASPDNISPDNISVERATLYEPDDIDGSGIHNGKSNGVSTATFATNGSHSALASDSLIPTEQAEQADSGSNHSTVASIGSFASINSRAETSNGSSVGDGASLSSDGKENKDEFASLTKSYSDKGKRDDMPNESSDSESEVNLDETVAIAENANSVITIKGRTDGIAIEVGAGSWRMLMVQLRQRLQQSSGFFRGGAVSLDVGERSLTDEELAQAKEILNEHGLNLNLVRSTSEETSQSSSALGVAVTLDKADAAVAQSALTNHDSLDHFVYRGNLRSGQVLRRTETILILGDVNPGAHVESEGDILIWGRLRGIAHAGANGDSNAIVSAMLMEPTQLRISDSIAIMPSTDERRSLFGVKKRNPDLAPRPEVAYIAEDTIVVEPWDESKPGGIMAFRRS